MVGYFESSHVSFFHTQTMKTKRNNDAVLFSFQTTISDRISVVESERSLWNLEQYKEMIYPKRWNEDMNS